MFWSRPLTDAELRFVHRFFAHSLDALQPHLRANNGEVLREAAIAGMGIIAQPDFIIDQALADGRLVPVLPEWEVPAIGIYAVYTSRSHLAPKVRSFIDYLVECLDEDAARSD